MLGSDTRVFTVFEFTVYAGFVAAVQSPSYGIILIPCGVSHGKRNYSLTLDNFSLSS